MKTRGKRADSLEEMVKRFVPGEAVSVADVRLDGQPALEAWTSMLSDWPPAAREFDLKEAVAYARQQPPWKTSAVYAKAIELGETLVEPRSGVTPFSAYLQMCRAMEEAGVDIVGVNADTYSRHFDFAATQKRVDEAEHFGQTNLNGFPIINYGVKRCRELNEALQVPLCHRVRSSPVSFAAGFLQKACISPFQHLAYSKDGDLSRTIMLEQRVCRALAYLEESHGIPCASEVVTHLTGTLCPPGLMGALTVIGCLLTARQGIRVIIPLPGVNGCLKQDVALIMVTKEIFNEYLPRLGHRQVAVGVGISQWMGAFPVDEAQAVALISMCTASAVLGGANLVVTKTPHEHHGTPDTAAQVAGIRATKQVITMLRGQRLEPSEELEEEKEILRLEMRAILDAVLELGHGDLAVGSVRALPAGIVDIPFVADVRNPGRVMPVRDSSGAVRYLDPGGLPLPDRVRRFHRGKVEGRARAENRPMDYKVVSEDIFALGREITARAMRERFQHGQ